MLCHVVYRSDTTLIFNPITMSTKQSNTSYSKNMLSCACNLRITLQGNLKLFRTYLYICSKTPKYKYVYVFIKKKNRSTYTIGYAP